MRGLPYICIVLIFSFQASAEELSSCHQYTVYGGDTFTTSEVNWWMKGYRPEDYGYTFLGTGEHTNTFAGTHNYYIINTRPGNVAHVDAVEGTSGLFLNTLITGNTPDYTNSWNAPDNIPAHIGGEFINSSGFIVVNASSHQLNSLTVHNTAPVYSFFTNHIEFSGNVSVLLDSTGSTVSSFKYDNGVSIGEAFNGYLRFNWSNISIEHDISNPPIWVEYNFGSSRPTLQFSSGKKCIKKTLSLTLVDNVSMSVPPFDTLPEFHRCLELNGVDPLSQTFDFVLYHGDVYPSRSDSVIDYEYTVILFDLNNNIVDGFDEKQGWNTFPYGCLIYYESDDLGLQVTAVAALDLIDIHDADNDGLPDNWETLYNLDPADQLDALSDLDSDGLTALEEYQTGTLPDNSDSDGDGLPDGYEVQYSLILDPTDNSDASMDQDNDGLNSLAEYNAGTQPDNPDSDSDGRIDGEDSNPLVATPNLCSGDNVVLINDVYATGTIFDCRAQASIRTSGTVTVESGAEVLYMAPSLRLETGFGVESGGIFHAVGAEDVAP